jgi:hypothetical protein
MPRLKPAIEPFLIVQSSALLTIAMALPPVRASDDSKAVQIERHAADRDMTPCVFRHTQVGAEIVAAWLTNDEMIIRVAR